MPSRTPRTHIIAIAGALVVTGLAGRADAQVPPGNQALLLLRVLAYDRKLPSRATDSVTIAVLHRAGNGASEAAAKDILTALEDAAKKTTVAGKPVKVARVAYGSAAQLDADVQAARASALYVCRGLDEDVEAISKVARARSLLSFTGTEAYVDAGLAIGLVRRQEKAAIVVFLAAAKAEGADLDAALLARAEVRR